MYKKEIEATYNKFKNLSLDQQILIYQLIKMLLM